MANPLITPARALSSASSLQRRALCKGSALAEHGLPSEESSDAAEGTLLHNLDANPELDRSELDEEQVFALEKNKALRDEFFARSLSSLGVPNDAPRKEFVEQELWLCGVDGLPWKSPLNGEGFPGHPDRVVYFPEQKVAVIFDSKFGRIEVPHSAINYQLKVYAVMFAENFECNKVIVAITQPRCSNPFHAAEYSGKDIPKFKQEILNILADTLDLNAKRVPSIEACKYCRAQGTERCPESLQVAKDIAVTRIDELTIDQLEAMSTQIELAKSVCEAWTDRMKAILATNPELIKHHELKSTGNTRSCKDSAAAFDRAFKAGYLGTDIRNAALEFNTCVTVSIPKLETLVGKNLGLKKELAKLRVSDALLDAIEEKPKAPSLKRKKE